jgi:NifU-like protein involved in Fe-S cluster formation
MSKNTDEIKKIKQDYKNFILEMNKLQAQQKQILFEYAKRLKDIKLEKIRKKL